MSSVGDSEDQAREVATRVIERNGRFEVEILVVFPDRCVRKVVGDYPTRRKAEIAASWICRAADRDIEGPVHG